MNVYDNPYAQLQTSVRKCFDIIRGHVQGDEYHLITFLLWLKSEGIISSFGSSDGFIRDFFINDIEKYCGDEEDMVQDLLAQFKSTLEEIDFGALVSLCNFIDSINIESLRSYFKEIFEDLLYTITKAEGRAGGEHIMPIELSRFACNLFDTNLMSVYNPFAGLASFSIFLNDQSIYVGEEINQRTKSLGELRLLVHKKIDRAFLFQNDSIKNWNANNWKYDLIISTPPFGIRFEKGVNESENIRTVEQFLIQKGIEDLKENGKLIVFVPVAFLFRGGSEQYLREKLINEDLLEMVVSFPGGLLTNTGIPVALLVINKNKKRKGFVRFVNAESFVTKPLPREKKLDDKSLNSIVWNEEDSDVIRIVPKEVIQLYEYNLAVNRYFLDILEGDLFGDLVSPANATKPPVGTKGRFVRIRDLKDDNIEFALVPSELEISDIPRHSLQINEPVLLLAIRWSSLKPTFFDFQGEPIFISPDIIALSVNTQRVDVSYLITELHTAYVNSQLNLIRLSDSIPTIRKPDLFRIKINVIPLEQQIAKVRGAKEALYQEKKREIEYFEKIHGLKNEIYEQNSFLRHSIAGSLKNIRGAFKGLKTIIETQILPAMPNVYNYKTSSTSELDFGRYLEILERDLFKVSETTRRNGFENKMIEQTTLQPVEMIGFLKQYVSELRSRDNLIFSPDFDFDNESMLDTEGNLINAYIDGNEDLLRTMLNNLVDNAEIHAFNRTKSDKNRIEFYLMVETETEIPKLVLLVSNTGKPMPPGFTFEMYIRKGSKAGPNAGDGFGGWYINEIIKRHGGEFDFIDESGAEGLPDTDLATSFEIVFPLTSND